MVNISCDGYPTIRVFNAVRALSAFVGNNPIKVTAKIVLLNNFSFGGESKPSEQTK